MMADKMQEQWDRQAFIYAAEQGLSQFGPFLELYEVDCWRYIEPTLPEVGGSLILEVGCGTGRWVFRLAPKGYRMVLSDLSPEMVRQAQAKVVRQGLDDHIDAYHILDICDMHALPDASFDLVLALGGPLTLCRDAKLATEELHRVTKPGGYVICDAANRYRTALDLIHTRNTGQFGQMLATGQFPRPDGLTDYRFRPQELAGLFEASGLRVRRLAAICPFFDFLPSEDQVRILDDRHVFEIMADTSRRYGEDPAMIGLSGRLLIVTRRQV
jgi:SAM-dependent methyltransferase